MQTTAEDECVLASRLLAIGSFEVQARDERSQVRIAPPDLTDRAFEGAVLRRKGPKAAADGGLGLDQLHLVTETAPAANDRLALPPGPV